jgi:hypothetical protein
MKHIYNLTVTEKYFVTTNMEKSEDSLANFLFRGSNNNYIGYLPALDLNNKHDYPRNSLFHNGRQDTL